MPIETREVNYKEPDSIQAEFGIVRYTCPKCRKLNHPHGYEQMPLPLVEVNTCSCGFQEQHTWLDRKGRWDLSRKKAGLSIQSGSDPEKEALKAEVLRLKKRLSKYEGDDKPQDIIYSDAEEDE